MSKATNPSQTLIHDFQTSIVSDVLIAISPEHGQKLAVLLAKFNQNILTNIVPIISEINTLKSAIIDEARAPTPPPSMDNNLTMMIEERDDKENTSQSSLDTYYKLLSDCPRQPVRPTGYHDSGSSTVPVLPFGAPWTTLMEESEEEDESEEESNEEPDDESAEDSNEEPDEESAEDLGAAYATLVDDLVQKQTE